MTKVTERVLALLGLGSIILGLLFIIVTLTVAFRRIEEVERRVATPGKQLDMIRSNFGGGAVGRWMRAIHVFAFLVFKNIPCYGPWYASRVGDEVEPLPLKLKLWVILPVGLANLFVIIFFITTGMLSVPSAS